MSRLRDGSKIGLVGPLDTMTKEDPESTATRELLVRFLALRYGGDDTPFEEWVREYPDREGELRRLLHDITEVERCLVHAGGQTQVGSLLYTLSSIGRDEAERGDPSDRFRGGSILGDYRLERPLGRGGMGQVWEATDLSLGRRVALKLLTSEARRPRARFQREAEAGARLNHPNIATIYESGEVDGISYIAQELVEGGSTLADFILRCQESTALSPSYYEHVATFIARVADGLDFAHQRSVIHRDVKPRNILVMPNDEPKIVDFGLARLIDRDPLTVTGELAGTICYMSPEQVRGNKNSIDRRTDVFSLGVTLYELLALTRAFGGKSTSEVADKILYYDPPNPREKRPSVPRDLVIICRKAMEKRPSLRYSTAGEMAADLRRFLAHEPILGRPTRVWERARKWMARHPIRSSALMIAVLASIAIGVSIDNAVVARRSRRLADGENCILRAEMATYRGDLASGRSFVAEAERHIPGDPRGQLILAMGCASLGLFEEAREHVATARSMGFPKEAWEPVSARDYLSRALFTIATRRPDGFPDARADLESALRLDRDLSAALFPLYQVEKYLGDDDDARTTLQRYAAAVPANSPIHAFVTGLILELEGRYDDAIECLEGLRSRKGEAQDLGIPRALGRIYLLAGRLPEAKASLRDAVSAIPTDAASWSNLAMVHALEFRARGAVSARDAAIDCAERSLELGLQLTNPHRVLVDVAMWDLERDESPAAPFEGAARSALEERLSAFRALAPGDLALAQAEAQLAYLEGVAFEETQRVQDAEERYTAALAAYASHVPARVRLASRMWFDSRYEEALEQLDHAEAAWNEWTESGPSWPGTGWSARWAVTIQVWRLMSANSLRLTDVALDARSRVEQALAGGAELEPDDVVNFAEALALSPMAEIRDCPRALELIRVHRIREQHGASPGMPETLDGIEAACR